MSDKEPVKPQDTPAKDPSQGRNAGGIFIAFGAIAGAIVGGFMGQPSLGLLAGLSLGIFVALLIWFKER